MSDTIPVMRPRLPTLPQLAPYLERIDASRWYTNHGPLTREFEERLAAHFGVEASRVVTLANGTLGMMHALSAFGAKPGSLCAIPSWTFVATAAAVRAAGLTPFFVDVDPETWSITPEGVRRAALRGEVGAAIPVAPFGAPIDPVAWMAFARESGIPVLLDAAAGFDTYAAGGPCPLGAGVSAMVSLHATKVFGVGEGAAIVAQTAELAQAMRLQGNFGFLGSREASIAGINSKMSEYAAALGLASFDAWGEARREWGRLSDAHAALLRAAGGLRSTPRFNDGWVSCYGLVELPAGGSVEAAGSAFRARGVETRAWWGRGCHRQPAYRDCPREDLPVTEDLAGRVLGLPFWPGMDDAQFGRVGAALTAALRE